MTQQSTGRVTDTTGAVVLKATIIVLNQKTNVSITTKTTGAGVYTVPYLTPGLYTVTAESAGFSRVAETEITLAVGQTATNPYDAQYGRASGGVIDMTLKSGTFKLPRRSNTFTETLSPRSIKTSQLETGSHCDMAFGSGS